MQKWDYLIIKQWRSYLDREVGKPLHMPADWQFKILEKGQEKVWIGEISKLLEEKGNEGWELVAVVPISSLLGGAHSVDGAIKPEPLTYGSVGTIAGVTTDFAGFTTLKEWVFKRLR